MDSLAGFFKEEAIYIIISLFVFAIAAIVVTRPFVKLDPKKVLPGVALFLIAALLIHYNMRISHIKSVKKAFEDGKEIICLDKTNKIGHVLVRKGEWRLEGDLFVNPAFYRGYNIRQCLISDD